MNYQQLQYGHKLEQMSSGSYGKIYLSNLGYVFKQMNKINRYQEYYNILENVLTEIAIMSKLDHPNIIKYLDVFEDKHDILIVMNRYDGDLQQLLNQKIKLELDLWTNISGQIIQGLHYLHQNDILHGDLKPNNIFYKYDGTYQIVIGDFGLARNRVSYKFVKNPNFYNLSFRPPEIELNFEHKLSADIWALGCICYQLYTGHLLIDFTAKDFISIDQTKIFQMAGFVPDDRHQKFELLAHYYLINKIYQYFGLPDQTSPIYQRFRDRIYLENVGYGANLVDVKHVNDFLLQMLNPTPEKRLTTFELITNKNETKNQLIQTYQFDYGGIVPIKTEQQLLGFIKLALQLKKQFNISDYAYHLAIEIYKYYFSTKNKPGKEKFQLAAAIQTAVSFNNENIKSSELLKLCQISDQKLLKYCLNLSRMINWNFDIKTSYHIIIEKLKTCSDKIIKLSLGLLNIFSIIWYVEDLVNQIILIASNYYNSEIGLDIEDIKVMKLLITFIDKNHQNKELTLYPFVSRKKWQKIRDMVKDH